MKTLIAIPCMDMVHTVFFKAMLAMRLVGDTRYTVSSSSLVYDARNNMVRQAIREGFDRILWLDSDMDFQPDLMEKLSADLDEGRELVSGLYFKRKAPIEPVVYAKVGYYHDPDKQEVTPLAVSHSDYPQNDVFEIEGCGFGGVMMTVDLARRVSDKFGLPFAPILGFGEDLSFCLRARELGATLWCDSRIKLGHVGQGVITEDVYLQQKAQNPPKEASK